MIEKRLTTRLISYWERIRQDNDIPKIQSFNPQAVHDLWDNCFQVSLHKSDNKTHYVYEYIGNSLTDVFDNRLVGQRVTSKLHFMPVKHMVSHMDKSLEDPKPHTIEGQFVDEKSHTIKYRSCLLPFGYDKDNVTDFIVGVSWNSFR